jgi:NAD+-dependent secondary alcohol dehydrogenase Adh1
MKAARLHTYDEDHLHIDDIPEPKLQGPHDVIVRIGAAGLCRTDLHIIEGVWRGTLDPELPYTLGHENAGWVHEVGDSVTAVQPGDTVILHPKASCGVCAGCRRGEDMYCPTGPFPGLDSEGGFAEYVRTSERALVKMAPNLEPKQVAPFADAGLTAYRAAKKASRVTPPGSTCVIIGIGGLGHIALQCLKEMSAADIIGVDLNAEHREHAEELGANHAVEGGEGVVDRVKELTGGQGVEAVIDFVGEHGTTEQGPAMLRPGGTYFVVGYGGSVDVPALTYIFNEVSTVGTLVGSYTDLSELMELAARDKVRLSMREYRLDDINQSIDDLYAGRFQGRAVLVP